jgi:hypothetical protein
VEILKKVESASRTCSSDQSLACGYVLRNRKCSRLQYESNTVGFTRERLMIHARVRWIQYNRTTTSRAECAAPTQASCTFALVFLNASSSLAHSLQNAVPSPRLQYPAFSEPSTTAFVTSTYRTPLPGTSYIASSRTVSIIPRRPLAPPPRSLA